MSQQAALPVEPPEELARLREDLIVFYRPVNSQERMAIEHLALAQQSMLRAARVESSLFANPPGEALHTILETEGFKLLLRYQAQAERAYRRALEELKFLQAQRPLMPAAPQLPAPAPKPQPIASHAAAAPTSPPHNPAAIAPSAAPNRRHATASDGNLALRL
jgi:hypothetical protein